MTATVPPPQTVAPASQDPATWTPRRRRMIGWSMTTMLLVLMMISWADKAILGIVAVPLMNDLGITPSQFGLLGSAVFMLFGIAQFVAAPIANRVKSKWILLTLCLIWSIAQVPIFVFASLPALWFSRLLLGAGEGPLAPISMHAAYKWFPAAKSATPASIVSSGVTLGIVAFAPVLAWISSEFGWKSTFVFLAIIGVVWSVIWVIVGREGPYTSAREEARIEGTAATIVDERAAAAADTKVPYLRSFLTPTWLLAVLCSFLGYWTFTVATTWLPAYYETVLGTTTQQGGSLIALPAIWGTIATIGLGWFTQVLSARGLATRKSRGLVLGGAALFAGVMVIAGTVVADPTLATICFMFGFGTSPALFAMTYLIAAETSSVSQRGAVLQITNAFLTAGGLCAPMVVGFLVDGAPTAAIGYSNAFLLTGAMLAVAGLAACLFINQQRDRRKLGLDIA
ncbi:MFS transporter [Salinibacterium sp. dk2585]|uniref:MFS transporter n=1 Tax=unclassified Salinibacterium TaxID=2632331 RepID=UPI0011C24348|nr:MULTISPECIES: MFS transporter [unclassified Salinibacterium]QEE61430.1 MFS transporter [Salinibacterium sp. dk2585]TXK54107.1 MFS transporter [Salinibacterium sp. dk5596]